METSPSAFADRDSLSGPPRYNSDMQTIYRSFFEKSLGMLVYNTAFELLLLTCADCYRPVTRLAIQPPLWEPTFEFEATFRYAEGKLHFLFMPPAGSDASEEWWHGNRQRYRMVFLPR